MTRRLRQLFTAMRVHTLKKDEFYNTALRAIFREQYGIDIGLYTYGCFDPWRMPGPLKVGRYCSIAKTVRSTNNNHPLDALTTSPVLYHRYFGAVETDTTWDGHLIIEDDVWIGHNVTILPGCRTIGRGAVIGAGAIVTRDVDRYAVVAGNPARKLRDRFSPELSAAIEATRWWERDVADLKHLLKTHPDVLRKPDLGNITRLSFTSPTELVDPVPPGSRTAMET